MLENRVRAACVSSAQPRLAQRRIVGHHQHVDEEPVDRLR